MHKKNMKTLSTLISLMFVLSCSSAFAAASSGHSDGDKGADVVAAASSGHSDGDKAKDSAVATVAPKSKKHAHKHHAKADKK